jgi:hypothetical protein
MEYLDFRIFDIPRIEEENLGVLQSVRFLAQDLPHLTEVYGFNYVGNDVPDIIRQWSSLPSQVKTIFIRSKDCQFGATFADIYGEVDAEEAVEVMLPDIHGNVDAFVGLIGGITSNPTRSFAPSLKLIEYFVATRSVRSAMAFAGILATLAAHPMEPIPAAFMAALDLCQAERITDAPNDNIIFMSMEQVLRNKQRDMNACFVGSLLLVTEPNRSLFA